MFRLILPPLLEKEWASLLKIEMWREEKGQFRMRMFVENPSVFPFEFYESNEPRMIRMKYEDMSDAIKYRWVPSNLNIEKKFASVEKLWYAAQNEGYNKNSDICFAVAAVLYYVYRKTGEIPWDLESLLTGIIVK